MEENSLKGLNEEYAALIKEYLEKIKGFLRKIIPQARREIKERGIMRVGGAWVWPVKSGTATGFSG